jgi:hypothetical protein
VYDDASILFFNRSFHSEPPSDVGFMVSTKDPGHTTPLPHPGAAFASQNEIV